MNSRKTRLHANRLLAVLLCGGALLTLWSCAKAPQTLPTTQAVSTSTPPLAPARHTPAPILTYAQGPFGPTTLFSPRDLPNFHAVVPGLLRGAAPMPAGLEALQKMGVKTVIDLRIAPKTVAKERAQLGRMGVHFINLPMSGEPPTAAQIKTFLDTVGDPAQQPVFVHCQHGSDRTGTMVGIYREQVAHWPFDRTYKEMRKYGFNPHWKKLTATVRRFAPAEAPR